MAVLLLGYNFYNMEKMDYLVNNIEIILKVTYFLITTDQNKFQMFNI